MGKERIISFEADGRFFHKRGVRSLDKQEYLQGLRSLRKALEMAPDDTQILMDLADAYARMGLYEASNMELGLLLHKSDCPGEAIFAMGSNCMSMGDYAQAYQVFEAYLSKEPDGEFAYMARDSIEQIVESEVEDGLEREVESLAEQGKAALDYGEPERAVEIFLRVLETDPELLYVRNNLALAYLCMEEADKAWEQLHIIFEADAFNVHALCNAALLAKAERKLNKMQAYMDKMDPDRMEETDELYKYCLTAAELKMEQALERGLNRMLLLCPYEVTMLYLMGVIRYNQGKYPEAIKIFEKLNLLEPANILSRDAIKHCHRRMEGRRAPKTLALSFEYGTEQVRQIDRCMLALMRLYPDQNAVVEQLNQRETAQMMEAALLGEDDMVAHAIILLTAAGGPVAQNLLRRVLLSVTHGPMLKQMAVEGLKQIGAPEPYYAFVEGRIVLMHSGEIKLEHALPEEYTRMLGDIVQDMVDIYGDEDAAGFTLNLWTRYLNRLDGKFPAISDIGGWLAATRALYELHVLKKKPDYGALAQEEETTARTAKLRAGRLGAALSLEDADAPEDV